MKKHQIFCSALVLSAFLQATYAQDFPGFGSVPDEEKPELSGVYTVSKTAEKALSGVQYKSTEEDVSVVLIKDGGKAELLKAILEKAGDSSNDGQSNFYGLNAAVVVADGSSLTLKDVSVFSDADGANAIFSTGEGSLVTIKGITIHTIQNSSRGLDSTYGGKIVAQNVDITTEGAHSAAFATDRGEGTVTVTGGKAQTSGEGSPVIYSTGNISVNSLTGTATGSEMAVIEGKNSISIVKSTLSGAGPQGIMLYQSMSGDANVGTSVFSVSDSNLTSTSKGPFFYVTNTQAVINLKNSKLNNTASSVLLKVSGNNSERGWGEIGANGGTLTFNAEKQQLSGEIICDSISNLTLNLNKNSVFSGSINEKNEGIVNLSIAKNAKVQFTKDSYINEFVDSDVKFANISAPNCTIYYNKNVGKNAYLGGKTYSLKNGGTLSPFEGKSDSEISEFQAELNKRHGKNRPDGNPHGNPEFHGNPPKPQKISGTVRVNGEGENAQLTLLTDEGKTYVLRFFSDRKEPQGEPNGNPHGEPNGNPPPENAPKDAKHPENHHKNPPKPDFKPVQKSDLAALAGTRVIIEGFAPPTENDELVFEVMSYTNAAEAEK